MKLPVIAAGTAVAASLVVGLAVGAAAQTVGPNQGYLPRLADIMAVIQLRHTKLYFAGKARNWALADYALGQIHSSLQDAATLYPGIPVTNMSIVADPIRRLSDVIARKDAAKFEAVYADLTTACNGCHQANDRGYIVIKSPTVNIFSNQSFAAPK